MPVLEYCADQSTKSAAIVFIASIFDSPEKHFTWRNYLEQQDDEIWVTKVNKVVVSAIIVRRVNMLSGLWGIAIGMVATAPNHRNKGLAKSLINAAVKHYDALGAIFAVLWARKELLPVYQSAGFTNVVREYDCIINLQNTTDGFDEGLSFLDFNSANHIALDSLRRKWEQTAQFGNSESTILRQFAQGQWCRISGPRGNTFSLLTSSDPNNPEFYAIIAHGEQVNLIIEFVGESTDLNRVVTWISQELKPNPISFSVTSKALENIVSNAYVSERNVNFYTMRRQLDSQVHITPHMTWLDRL
jgi:GNAT superfamily N-acetyltransferase